MRRSILLLGVLSVLAAPTPALASVQRSGQVVSVTERIEDDLYAAGAAVDVSGPVEGDVTAAGGTVAMSGPVTGSLVAAGGTFRFSGSVARSLRAAAGTISAGGRVEKDAILLGGTVLLERGAEVGRDLTAIGGTLRVLGTVGRRASLRGGSVVIGGTIRGDVTVDAGRVVLLPATRIQGRFRYQADMPAEIQQGAQVTGGVERVASARQVYREVRGRIPYAGRILEGLWLLVLGFVVIAVGPRGVSQVVGRIRRRFGLSLLTGFLLLVAVPVAAVLLALTVVGIPLAMVLVLLYAASLYPAQIFVAAWLGDLMLRPLTRGASSLYLTQVLGTVVLMVAVTIPTAGLILRLLALLLGFGGLWAAFWAGRPRPPALVIE